MQKDKKQNDTEPLCTSNIRDHTLLYLFNSSEMEAEEKMD